MLTMLASVAILVHAVVPHHHHNRLCASLVNVIGEGCLTQLSDHHDCGTHGHTGAHEGEECQLGESQAEAVRPLHESLKNTAPQDAQGWQHDFCCLLAQIFVSCCDDEAEGKPAAICIEGKLPLAALACGPLRAPPHSRF